MRCVRPHPRSITGNDLAGMVCLAGLTAPAPAAEPYTPNDPATVLTRLPRTVRSADTELTQQRRALAENPRDPELALAVATRYVALGRQAGDPRYDGYAQAVLAPWWDQDDAPAGLIRLRAKIKEKNHQYDDARADLEALLKRSPRDAQAYTEIVNLHRVQGDYAAARRACEAMQDVAAPAQVLVAQIPLDAVTGRAEETYHALAQLRPVAEQQLPELLPWVTALQAGVARSLGQVDQARHHFQQGLEHHPADAYLLRAYADFLIDQKQPDAAIELLKNHLHDNGALLLSAIAARRAGHQEQSDAWWGQLQQRFAAIRLRGGTPHGRFEARGVLALGGDPEHALQLALANWEHQKEMRDTRNVLEAAIAAYQPEAARPALDFLKRHGTQDTDLQRLARRLDPK